MDENKDIEKMLDLMSRPAFCAKGGQVCHSNAAARQLLLEPGTDIQTILAEDAAEYENFRDGCLYLTLNMGDQSVGAAVRRVGEMDVFVADSDEERIALQAMALASLPLRQNLSDVISLIEQLPPEDSARRTAFDGSMHKICRRLFQMQRNLVNMSDALNFSRERRSLLSERDAAGFIEEVVRHAGALAASAGVKLEYRGISQTVYTLIDSEKLERAIYNVLSNALKATPKGGTIRAELSLRGNKLYLSVTDGGKGIRDEVLSTAFTHFLRPPGITAGGDGTGLGMSLIRSVATGHGGTVLIDRPKSGGTRVTLTLAVRRDSGLLRSPTLTVDYAGERDHGVMELVDVLDDSWF